MNAPPEPFTFTLSAHWTPEQALVLYRLLSDLTEAIWTHYAPQLRPLISADLEALTCHDANAAVPALDDDPPF